MFNVINIHREGSLAYQIQVNLYQSQFCSVYKLLIHEKKGGGRENGEIEWTGE